MMDEYQTVPLQDGESALPLARVSVPHVAFAHTVVRDYAVVRIDDSSAYDVIPMQVLDTSRVNSNSY